MLLLSGKKTLDLVGPNQDSEVLEIHMFLSPSQFTYDVWRNQFLF